MNIQYLKEVTEIITPFMNEHGFSSKGLNLGVYMGELKAYKVAYNEEKKEFSVSVSPIDSDGNADAYVPLSTWYFDENDHGAKDTVCIGEDFLSAIAADAGIKSVKTADGSVKEVALPEKAAIGTDPGVEAFAQKFLAMFPQYKDSYKDMVAKYGDFMYVEFFKRYGIEKMNELCSDETANKKQLAKYWSMLGDMHYNGEFIVGDIICAVILAGSFGNNPAKYDELAEKYLADYPFLKTAGKTSVQNYKHDKKLRKLIEG
jgi:hypothetical protein